MCHTSVCVHCHVSLRQLIVLTKKIKCSITQDRKPERYPYGGPTLYNQRSCGKQRLYKRAKGYQSYLFLHEKNALQIRMNLNKFLKSFIKGNFIRGQNKDCEICSDLFVGVRVCMTDWQKKLKKASVGYFSKLERRYALWQWQHSEKCPSSFLPDLTTVFFVQIWI